MSSTQKAAFLDSQGGEFSVRETSIPKPGPGQLLVGIEDAGLTPADWKLQKYGYYIESWPTVIGLDLSGVVVELGEGVNGFAKGDRVFSQGFWTEGRGAFQQYAVIDAEVTAKIPSNISFAQAATLPTAVAAVVIGLYLPQPQGVGLSPPFESDTRGKEVAKSILIFGGAGIVGQIGMCDIDL
ncbi:hypothetical protein H0H93_014993 [Arthromyces matolae]|nr:hypothetical protein H0H93_014993 [Arthromyces matolae]